MHLTFGSNSTFILVITVPFTQMLFHKTELQVLWWQALYLSHCMVSWLGVTSASHTTHGKGIQSLGLVVLMKNGLKAWRCLLCIPRIVTD